MFFIAEHNLILQYTCIIWKFDGSINDMRVCRASSFQCILKLFLTFKKSKHTIEEF